MLGWHERFSTVIDYQKFFVQYDAYQVLKIISQTYPDLKLTPVHAFEKWTTLSSNTKPANIESIWDQIIEADTSEELFKKTQMQLLKTLKTWGAISTKQNIFTNQPDIALTIENLAQTEAKNRWSKSLPYYNLEDCFVAYSLSSFASLYSQQTFTYRKSQREILFATPQDLPEIELSWMKGYVTTLHPKVKTEKIKSLGKTLYHWTALP